MLELSQYLRSRKSFTGHTSNELKNVPVKARQGVIKRLKYTEIKSGNTSETPNAFVV